MLVYNFGNKQLAGDWDQMQGEILICKAFLSSALLVNNSGKLYFMKETAVSLFKLNFRVKELEVGREFFALTSTTGSYYVVGKIEVSLLTLLAMYY